MLASVVRPSQRVAISDRDRQIVTAAQAKVQGGRVDFADAARALREAVEEHIAGGRVFVLGATPRGPVIGSLISGIGIAESARGVAVVRMRPGERLVVLGRFAP